MLRYWLPTFSLLFLLIYLANRLRFTAHFLAANRRSEENAISFVAGCPPVHRRIWRPAAVPEEDVSEKLVSVAYLISLSNNFIFQITVDFCSFSNVVMNFRFNFRWHFDLEWWFLNFQKLLTDDGQISGRVPPQPRRPQSGCWEWCCVSSVRSCTLSDWIDFLNSKILKKTYKPRTRAK